MKRLLLAVLIAAVAAGLTIPGTAFAEPMNSINLGIGGVPQLMPHCKSTLYIVEYERMLGPNIAFLGRGSQVDYKFDDSEYQEQGKPTGIEVGTRYYSNGNMQGLFIGGVVGYWMTDWRFIHHRGLSNEVQGAGDSDSFRANVDIGGRFPIGSSSVSIMPAINLGKFFSATSCDYTAPASQVGQPCHQRTEVEYYMFVSLTAGYQF